MTWDEAKANSDILINKIETILKKNKPTSITDVYHAVKKIDKDTQIIPNPNSDGQYCQLVLYPSPKWKTWRQTSMSISDYDLYI